MYDRSPGGERPKRLGRPLSSDNIFTIHRFLIMWETIVHREEGPEDSRGAASVSCSRWSTPASRPGDVHAMDVDVQILEPCHGRRPQDRPVCERPVVVDGRVLADRQRTRDEADVDLALLEIGVPRPVASGSWSRGSTADS